MSQSRAWCPSFWQWKHLFSLAGALHCAAKWPLSHERHLKHVCCPLPKSLTRQRDQPTCNQLASPICTAVLGHLTYRLTTIYKIFNETKITETGNGMVQTLNHLVVLKDDAVRWMYELKKNIYLYV